MKLQVGCSAVRGQYRQSEWINLDIVNQRGTNILGDGTKLPFADNSFDEVHCVHVLEHVTRDQYPLFLKEMHRVIKPGRHNRVFVETPDFERTVGNLWRAFDNEYEEDIHIWTTSVYGKNEREGMAHYWGFYEGLLVRAFRTAGFKCVVREHSDMKMISTHYKQEPVLLVRGSK